MVCCSCRSFAPIGAFSGVVGPTRGLRPWLQTAAALRLWKGCAWSAVLGTSVLLRSVGVGFVGGGLFGGRFVSGWVVGEEGGAPVRVELGEGEAEGGLGGVVELGALGERADPGVSGRAAPALGDVAEHVVALHIHVEVVLGRGGAEVGH